jgi:predicted kinase
MSDRTETSAGRPKLVVLAGLPGTGKSTLARLLAAECNALWLRVDSIEAALLEAGIPRSFETGLAAYVVARDVARDHLEIGRDVVIDAVNGVEEARQMWRDLALECHADRYVVELQCSDAVVHRHRVESRTPPTPPLPKPTWDEVLQRAYVPWAEPVLVVDGLRSAEEILPKVREYLIARARTPRSL